MALKILFSPSESKISLNTSDKFNSKNLIFPKLFSKRAEILNKYDEFLKLSQRDRLTSEIAPPEEGDFTAEGSEFVIILPYAVSEKYENAIYNVWLKK